METSSTSGKANLPLAHSNLLHYFCIGLNLLSFRREPQGGKNLIPAKKKDFFPSVFLLSLVHTSSLFSISRYLQTKWGIVCIAINGDRLAEMFSLFGFINHCQHRFFSRTDTFLTIIYPSTATRSDNIVYHQHMLPRIGQRELAFLLLQLRK